MRVSLYWIPIIPSWKFTLNANSGAAEREEREEVALFALQFVRCLLCLSTIPPALSTSTIDCNADVAFDVT